MVSIPLVSDDKEERESGSTTNDKNSTKDDLHFSWDDLPDKFMREEYELRMPSGSMHVSEDTKVRKNCKD